MEERWVRDKSWGESIGFDCSYIVLFLLQIEIVHARANRQVCTVKGVRREGRGRGEHEMCVLQYFGQILQISKSSTIGDVKNSIGRQKKKYSDVNRQELRLEPKGKALKDEDTLGDVGVEHQAILYFKDRGIQIGWTTVFLTEYAGPLIVYLWFYTRPWIFYGEGAAEKAMQPVVKYV